MHTCVAIKQGIWVETLGSWENHSSKSCKILKYEKGLWQKSINNNITIGITKKGYDKGITSNKIGNNPIENRKKLRLKKRILGNYRRRRTNKIGCNHKLTTSRNKSHALPIIGWKRLKHWCYISFITKSKVNHF
jgi:hypothetical protein